MEYTAADLEYVASEYVPLAEVCADRPESVEEVQLLIEDGRLPKPSYLLGDGTGMVPRDYFRLVDEAGGPAALRDEFERRHAAACRAEGADPGELQADWEGYISGIYGVCLREVSPETIIRKTVLVDSLTQLLAEPRPESADWRHRLREEVDELDELERPFAPDYDRNLERFGRPPTRDLLIEASRERYPEVFERPRVS
jgi:Family of unknown function (DUF6058)